MINLYRCIRYPYRTLVSFQATEEDITALRNLLPFEIKESDIERTGLAESGHYVYLSGINREQYEQKALKYFQENFCPPQIELLTFKGIVGNRPIQEKWSDNRLHRFLTKTIRQYFEREGYIVESANFGCEVYRKEPQQILPELQAFEGISYRIQIERNFILFLQADVVYRFHLNARPCSQKTLQSRFVNRPDVISSLKKFVTRDTDEIFKLAARFVKALQKINELTNICYFISEPMNTDSLGMKTWIWQHDFPSELEIGKGKIVPLASYISNENETIYMPPKTPIVVMLFYPDENFNKWCKNHNFSNLSYLIKITLKSLIGNDLNVPILLKKYSIPVANNEENKIVKECEDFLNSFDKITPLSLIISPPETSKDSLDIELRAVNCFTAKLDKRLRNLKGYTVTLGWDNLAVKNEQKYVVENAILKGLTALGATLWRIFNIAHENKYNIKDICFIGVDINICKKDCPIVGGVILDAYGVLQGQHIVKLPSPNGDSIDSDSFNLLIYKLISHFHTVTGQSPKHIIIHRDGLIGNETSKIISWLDKNLIDYDIIEVRKSGSPRIRQKGNIAGTPIRDITVGSEESATAHLVNTLVFKENLSTEKSIFPAPESITICRVIGNTPIKILAAQVHALSRAYYGSYRRTEKLPATIIYADSLVSHASLKNEQTDFGRPINSRSRLTWL